MHGRRARTDVSISPQILLPSTWNQIVSFEPLTGLSPGRGHAEPLHTRHTRRGSPSTMIVSACLRQSPHPELSTKIQSQRTNEPTPPAESVLLFTLRAACVRAFSGSSTLLFVFARLATSSVKVKLLGEILKRNFGLGGRESCSVTPSKRLSLHFVCIFCADAEKGGRKPQTCRKFQK